MKSKEHDQTRVPKPLPAEIKKPLPAEIKTQEVEGEVFKHKSSKFESSGPPLINKPDFEDRLGPGPLRPRLIFVFPLFISDLAVTCMVGVSV